MEGENLIGPATAPLEGLAGILKAEEGVLKDPALKKRCIMQYATGAAKGAKFLSSLQARSRSIAATALVSMAEMIERHGETSVVLTSPDQALSAVERIIVIIMTVSNISSTPSVSN